MVNLTMIMKILLQKLRVIIIVLNSIYFFKCILVSPLSVYVLYLTLYLMALLPGPSRSAIGHHSRNGQCHTKAKSIFFLCKMDLMFHRVRIYMYNYRNDE